MMIQNHPCGTIRLEGEAALDFIKSLYHPSPEETKRKNMILDDINARVTIREFDDGSFEAEIKNLDLSFLDEIEEEK